MQFLLWYSAKKEFLWGYYFCIENNSNHKISLVGKSWHITDDRGNNYSDDSAGFKGEIPDLEPGEYYEFSSTAPLFSSNAVFYGSCKIKADNDEVKDLSGSYRFSHDRLLHDRCG